MPTLEAAKNLSLIYYLSGVSAIGSAAMDWARARKRFLLYAALFLFTLFPWGEYARAYSLLTHEQLIDLTWTDSIVPLLLRSYPTLTAEELEQARAYAYGGCVIQDIGYYPYGDQSFSNLTHYVRSGDFVVNLFRNASNANELAFAVGALSHYIGDSEGHSLATNRAVPIEFPKLRKKYGSTVSYAQGKHEHVQTEFAFDINEISHHRMAPFRYLKHIGLAVPWRQLALAYYQTYGLTEEFAGTRSERLNVHEYQFAVRSFIPRIAYAVTILHRKVEPPDPNTEEIVALRKKVAEVSAENHWDEYRERPGLGTYSLAVLLFILPKIGPLKMAAVKGPRVDTEAEYVHSVSVSTASLRHMLARFTAPPSGRPGNASSSPTDAPSRGSTVLVGSDHSDGPVHRDPRHPLQNRDLDTGYVVRPGGYPLTDSTYANLLHRLTRQPTQPIPPGIKKDIETYYDNPDSPITTKKNPDAWKQVLADLDTLGTMPTSSEPTPFPTYGDDEEDLQ